LPRFSAGERRPAHLGRLAQLGALAAAFLVPTLVAKAFGAGWGTAATFGQIAFLAVLLALMLRAG
jgi:hypothetical protein